MQSLKVSVARYDALDMLGSGGPVVQDARKVRTHCVYFLSYQSRNRQLANLTVLHELDFASLVLADPRSKFISGHSSLHQTPT
jgi:hypothetical protein